MDYVGTAKDIARNVGKMIKDSMHDDYQIEAKESSYDIVTEIDRKAEKFIRESISESFPSHQFLGEENTFEDPRDYEEKMNKLDEIPYLWIVDPIDGTNNFVQGIQGFSVSIALLSYGELIAGVIYDPVIDEMFWAEKGKGAYLNEDPIQVSSKNSVQSSVIGVSISSKDKRRKMEMQSIESVASSCLSVRILGSAAINLAYVAAGRLDAFWHYNLSAWDVAAGVLIIKESGGEVTNMLGSDYSLTSNTIVGSNHALHEKLLTNIAI